MAGGGAVTRKLLALVLSATLALAACGGSDEGSGTTTTSRRATSTTASTSERSSTTSAPQKTTDVRVYLLRGEKVGPVRRSGPAGTPARAAIQALLAGPTAADRAAGLTSAVPAGTKLLGVTIVDDVATVDLSSQFGSGGGSQSMQARVAQVVFTLTQFPNVESVLFHMEGRPVTALGGEGVVLTSPQTRADWEALTPAILVEDPLPGDHLASPFHVKGTANTFEATFMVSLTDSTGTKRYERNAMATSGSGTRGTFDVQVAFSGAASGPGTLRLWESSAKDGSEINVVEIPVEL
jgi:hypothetical protein